MPAGEAVPTVDPPSPEIVDFIRFCHARRSVGWPELYDEMCAVAARREFRGWGHDDLAARGLAFSLPEMPRLATWVRALLAAESTVPRPAAEETEREGVRQAALTHAAQPAGA